MSKRPFEWAATRAEAHRDGVLLFIEEHSRGRWFWCSDPADADTFSLIAHGYAANGKEAMRCAESAARAQLTPKRRRPLRGRR